MNVLQPFATIERRIAQLERPLTTESDAFAANLRMPLSSRPVTRSIEKPAVLDPLVAANAARYGVDPALVAAVVACESGGDAAATSATGAAGLMQLMPATAAALGVVDPYDCAQNIAGGTRYLRMMLDRFGGDVRRAVAAYNAGPGAVERYDGVPPYPETQQYVANVLAAFGRARG